MASLISICLRRVNERIVAMTYELLQGLVIFSFVTSVTPGPNNLMLLASGVNFGFRRSIAHMLGIALGHGFMVFLVGLGLLGLFQSWPPARVVLMGVSALYMLWLAWRIANAAAPGAGMGAGKPLTFLQAAAFQWVNPKAIAMAFGAVALFAPGDDFLSALLVAGVFALVNLPSVGVWTVLGQSLRGLLARPRVLTVFNWSMAVLLVLSLVPVALSLDL